MLGEGEDEVVGEKCRRARAGRGVEELEIQTWHSGSEPALGMPFLRAATEEIRELVHIKLLCWCVGFYCRSMESCILP